MKGKSAVSNRDHIPTGETIESYAKKILATLPNGSVTHRESMGLKLYIEQLHTELEGLKEFVGSVAAKHSGFRRSSNFYYSQYHIIVHEARKLEKFNGKA